MTAAAKVDALVLELERELLDETFRTTLRADENECQIALALELQHERVDLRGSRHRDELVVDLALLGSFCNSAS